MMVVKKRNFSDAYRKESIWSKESKELHAQNLTRFDLIIAYALCCAVLSYPLVIYNIVSSDNHWDVMFWYPVSVVSSLGLWRMLLKIPLVYRPFIYSAMVVLLAYYLSTL